MIVLIIDVRMVVGGVNVWCFEFFMFELDLMLVQYIVDWVMVILLYNINVMDVQGMIIGSGDLLCLYICYEGV